MGYMVKLYAGRESSAQARHLATYLCRRWNDALADEPIERLVIDFMQERTLPGGLEDDPIRVPVVGVDCSQGSSL